MNDFSIEEIRRETIRQRNILINLHVQRAKQYIADAARVGRSNCDIKIPTQCKEGFRSLMKAEKLSVQFGYSDTADTEVHLFW